MEPTEPTKGSRMPTQPPKGPNILVHVESIVISHLITRGCGRLCSRDSNAESISCSVAVWRAILTRLPARRPPSCSFYQWKLLSVEKIAAHFAENTCKRCLGCLGLKTTSQNCFLLKLTRSSMYSCEQMYRSALVYTLKLAHRLHNTSLLSPP